MAEVESVRCGQCGTFLTEPTDLPVSGRVPCPTCGSKSRLFSVSIHATVRARSKLGLKAKYLGRGRPFVEMVGGDDLDRKTGKWMKLSRVIDREKDWYTETVTDPETGEIVHQTDEPLSQHQGHGDAKRSRIQKDSDA